MPNFPSPSPSCRCAVAPRERKREREPVHNENSGAEGGAPAADATFADQALDLWFDHEGSPFTESDEEFMPFV